MVGRTDTPSEPSGSQPVAPDHSHDVVTLANIITVLRLVLVPIFFAVLLTERHSVLAFALFALAASTDWIDGQIARRTGTVTEIGKALDPLVDRLLIASGVLGLYIIDRLPLWIVLVLVLRDLYLLTGASHLARRRIKALPVIYVGKVTTALLLAGFSGMIVDRPIVRGLGIVNTPALPGWGSGSVAVWIWLMYAGLVTSLVTAGVYSVQAWRALSGADVSE